MFGCGPFALAVSSVDNVSNVNARRRWNSRAVGAQRTAAGKGSPRYFAEIRAYRYGYETPFIPELLLRNVFNCEVLEIGVGNGIDAVELAKNGANYTGLDISENHIELTRLNLLQHQCSFRELICADLLSAATGRQYDVIYSFGVLHHIEHEAQYLAKCYDLLKPGGELRVALYSKYSFFNMYLLGTWIVRNRCRLPFNVWQGHVSDGAECDHPITIKIRSRRTIEVLYKAAGFEVAAYQKRGFVNNYLPIVGRFLRPGGPTLTLLGALLGWYHVYVLKKPCRVV